MLNLNRCRLQTNTAKSAGLIYFSRLVVFCQTQRSGFFMTVEDAKKILVGDVTIASTEILQEAAKIILSELEKAEEKIFALEKEKFELDKQDRCLSLEDLPGEVWKDIVGYEGLYQISNKGRLKSFYQGRIIIRKPSKNF